MAGTVLMVALGDRFGIFTYGVIMVVCLTIALLNKKWRFVHYVDTEALWHFLEIIKFVAIFTLISSPLDYYDLSCRMSIDLMSTGRFKIISRTSEFGCPYWEAISVANFREYYSELGKVCTVLSFFADKKQILRIYVKEQN